MKMLTQIFSPLFAVYVLTILSGVHAGHGSTMTYPACPTLQKTAASCGESKYLAGALTKSACDQLTANNKCNSNTNIYRYDTCNYIQNKSPTAPVTRGYCAASLVQSIDPNTWNSYCQAALTLALKASAGGPLGVGSQVPAINPIAVVGVSGVC